MGLKLTNNATSTLAGAINGSTTAIAVQGGDASKFPSLGAGDWFPATITDGTNMEIVRVTARSGANLTVIRAQEGTSGTAFASGSRITLRPTAAALAALPNPDAITEAAAKTTPADADEFGFWDSVANALKSLTWANLKAALFGSTTDVLTGTSTAAAVTPDGLAALWEKGADVASAGTLVLGEGGFFHVTGTTTITDIDFATPKNGRMAWLEFDASLTLTHHATTLVIPGGVNIVTRAGDRALVVQDNSDNVHVLAYHRASWQPGAGWEPIELNTALSAAASWSRTGLGAFSELRIMASLYPSSDAAAIFLRTDANGGASFDAGASDYTNQFNFNTSATAPASAPATQTGAYLTSDVDNGGHGTQISSLVFNFNKAAVCTVLTQATNMDGAAAFRYHFSIASARADANARDAIQIIASAGTLTGRVSLWGLRG